METAVELMDGARWRVKALVEDSWRTTGSKMRAYEDVAAQIGRSSSWIEKLIGRRLDTKRPDAVALMNIYAVYSRICEKVEAAADKQERKNAAHARAQTADQGAGGKPAPLDPFAIPPFLKREK